MKTCIGLIAGHSGDSLTDKLKNRGYAVALVGGRENEPAMNKADFTLIEDLSSHQNIASFFMDHSVSKIIVGTGHAKALSLVEYLNNRGFITNINHSKSLLAKDKIRFKNELINIDIKTPKFMSINITEEIPLEIIDEKIGIPCVIKSTTDAVQPQKVDTVSELIQAVEEVKATNTVVLIEEYIKGNDCTVAVVSDSNSVRSLGVTYYSKAKEYKLKGFESAYSNKLSDKKEEELNLIATQIVEKLGFTGVSRVDFIVDEKADLSYVLELNTVIVTGYNGSAYPFFKKQGIDIAEVMIDNSLKLVCEEYI